jgi:hypothetical protein
MYKSSKARARTNSTLQAIQGGSIRFKRRIDIQMWHPTHATQALRILEDLVSEMRRVINANQELTHPQKMWAIQTSILKANSDCANMRPSDPRVRGAEFGSFTHRGWTETNGHDALGSREDLSTL